MLAVRHDAGAAIGVVGSSLLARTGAVRITRHASAPPAPVAAAVSQPRSTVKRRSVDGNGGGGGNGGPPDPESQSSLTQSLLQQPQQQQQQQTFVLPFKAFCVGFSVATLVLVALAVGKQNIPALQKPLAPGAALHVSRFSHHITSPPRIRPPATQSSIPVQTQGVGTQLHGAAVDHALQSTDYTHQGRHPLDVHVEGSRSMRRALHIVSMNEEAVELPRCL